MECEVDILGLFGESPNEIINLLNGLRIGESS